MSVNKEEYLKQLAEELHKPVRKKFPRLKIRSPAPDAIWSMDLADMGEWASVNDGTKYMLNVVDVFTRYAWSRPLKSKSAIDTFAAFIDIVETSKRKPKSMWVDKGKEFYNSVFKKWMQQNDATMYSTYGESKSVIVERFNRTLKTAMWKQLTAMNSRRWIDILQSLVDNYNNRKHSTLKMTPREACEPQNYEKIKAIMDPKVTSKKGALRKSKFKLGDIVRISRVKGIFEKGFYPNWSREIFTVIGIKTPYDETQPITYSLRDRANENIEGSFYEQELQLVKNPEIFLVEKVLKTKKEKNGKTKLLIKWLGYPESMNSWIDEDQIIDDLRVSN